MGGSSHAGAAVAGLLCPRPGGPGAPFPTGPRPGRPSRSPRCWADPGVRSFSAGVGGPTPAPCAPSFCCSCERTRPPWSTQLGAQACQMVGGPLPRARTAHSLLAAHLWAGPPAPGWREASGWQKAGHPCAPRVSRRFAVAVAQERRDEHATVSLTWSLISVLAALPSNE